MSWLKPRRKVWNRINVLLLKSLLICYLWISGIFPPIIISRRILWNYLRKVWILSRKCRLFWKCCPRPANSSLSRLEEERTSCWKCSKRILSLKLIRPSLTIRRRRPIFSCSVILAGKTLLLISVGTKRSYLNKLPDLFLVKNLFSFY